jgi:hypothetical protein
LGQAYAITWPDVYIFRLGRLIALLSIPLAMVLYFLQGFCPASAPAIA